MTISLFFDRALILLNWSYHIVLERPDHTHHAFLDEYGRPSPPFQVDCTYEDAILISQLNQKTTNPRLLLLCCCCFLDPQRYVRSSIIRLCWSRWCCCIVFFKMATRASLRVPSFINTFTACGTLLTLLPFLEVCSSYYSNLLKCSNHTHIHTHTPNMLKHRTRSIEVHTSVCIVHRRETGHVEGVSGAIRERPFASEKSQTKGTFGNFTSCATSHGSSS